MEKHEHLIEHFWKLTDTVIDYLPVLAYSIAILFIGFCIAKRLDRALGKYFQRRNFDVSLEGFIRSLVSIGMKIVVIITFAGMIGLPTTSLLAVFGAAGLAVGLALQGSLSNFAGGVLILVFKPFRVGDTITAQNETGEVKEIQIFNTILLTPENKTIILANAAVSNGTIINITRYGNQRLTMKISIDFSEDVHRVREIILNILQNEPDVLKIPGPAVSIVEIAENTIILAVMPYVLPANGPRVQNAVYEKIRIAFVENHIVLPQTNRIVIAREGL